MSDEHDELRGELARLRARTPEPRAGLGDAVMQQVALRPRPRRSWWARFTETREVTLRFRWSRVAAWSGAAALAALACAVGLRGSLRQTAAPAIASAPAPDPQPVLIRFALPA